MPTKPHAITTLAVASALASMLAAEVARAPDALEAESRRRNRAAAV